MQTRMRACFLTDNPVDNFINESKQSLFIFN